MMSLRFGGTSIMTQLRQHLSWAAATAFLAFAAGAAFAADADDHTAYVRTDLISNLTTLAQPPDPALQNPWGVASAPGGPLWVSENHDGLSTLVHRRQRQ
jgi:hypothetical protein